MNKKLFFFAAALVCGAMVANAVDYGLMVANVTVTDANKDNITGEYITRGTVSYNAETKTLTLDNATINKGIITDSTLTISVIGTDTIINGVRGSSSETNVIDLTITGTGSLYGYYENSTAFYGDQTNLTIDSCLVTFKSGNTEGYALHAKSITLKQCTLTTPTEGYVADGWVYTKDGSFWVPYVVFTPVSTPMGIHTPEAAQPAVYALNGRIYGAEDIRIYSLTGADVTQQNGKLNGIYIVKTSDKATKVMVP